MECILINEARTVLLKCVARKEPLWKASVLLNALPADVIINVSREFRERDIRAILSVMSTMVSVQSIETVAVINDFFIIHDLWNTVGTALSEAGEITDAFIDWASQNPGQLGRLLKGTLLPRR